MKAHQSSASDRIYESIRSRIDSGAMRAGEKLPSTRLLAADLGVSRSTVVAIYEQLAAEGYIETKAGARARVSLGLKPLSPQRQASAAKRPHQVASISAYGKRIEVLALPQPPVTD
ncbi:MAG: GntR family transcriptional regulator, partial [Betaproteobacteria bacterium]|nr:GntR family transcriptional regulator [Betaproteobacteria bacterium]